MTQIEQEIWLRLRVSNLEQSIKNYCLALENEKVNERGKEGDEVIQRLYRVMKGLAYSDGPLEVSDGE